MAEVVLKEITSNNLKYNHGMKIRLLAWDGEVPDKVPTAFELEFWPTRYPGSRVGMKIHVEMDYGTELEDLIELLIEAQKTYEAYLVLA